MSEELIRVPTTAVRRTTEARSGEVVTPRRMTLLINLEFDRGDMPAQIQTSTQVGKQICKSVMRTWTSKDKVSGVTAWVDIPGGEPGFIFSIGDGIRRREDDQE